MKSIPFEEKDKSRCNAAAFGYLSYTQVNQNILKKANPHILSPNPRNLFS
jgi:hypothetical protein